MSDDLVLDLKDNEVAPGKTVRGFRGTAEVENLYRFINEFRLRREAKMAIEVIWAKLGRPAIKVKKKRGRKKKEKLQ